MNEEPFSYCFEIQEGDEVCYYNRCGIAGEIVPFYEFRIVPGFSTPDWAKGAVMYQIYIDRFCMVIRPTMWKQMNISTLVIIAAV